MNIRNLIAEQTKIAMKAAGIPTKFHAHVTPSKNPKFGDYQANGAMGAAKALKTNPRDLAQKIIDYMSLDDIASKIEIAGPGFINIHLDHSWLAQQVASSSNDDRLNIPQKTTPQTIVVDYSAPNLAKEMHVGHLRSTIIGDAIARVLEFLGDHVIRQNHVGDWGTQFGMLIAELELHMSEGEQAELALKDLESFYKQAKSHFDSDQVFANTAREYVVKLQSGDAKILKLWEQFRSISLAHNQEIYEKLNVTLNNDHVCGESSYNDDLAVLVEELKAQNLSQEDQGAQVVKLAELANKDGEPSVVIIQKNDGGYLYSTTDLAAIRYRVNTLKAQRILYFIDDRQSLHLKQVYTLARKAQFVPNETTLEHHAFGKMLGKDKTPFKTRAGGTVKLAALLEEAVERAASVIKDRENFSEQEMLTIANNVGIGAVKYADLSKTRTTDYVFDWESMLSFEGNTGPYLQYAYARICSIFDKAQLDMLKHNGAIEINTTQEKDLSIKILQLPEIIEQVSQEAYPHTLCTYLYELASTFMTFYEACPILKPEINTEQKASRLQLSKACAKTLELGLDLLGIKVMKKM